MLWYDGSTWTVLDQINDGDPDDKLQMTQIGPLTVPSGANNNANFALKFQTNGTDVFARVDDVVVKGTGM